MVRKEHGAGAGPEGSSGAEALRCGLWSPRIFSGYQATTPDLRRLSVPVSSYVKWKYSAASHGFGRHQEHKGATCLHSICRNTAFTPTMLLFFMTVFMNWSGRRAGCFCRALVHARQDTRRVCAYLAGTTAQLPPACFWVPSGCVRVWKSTAKWRGK